MEQPQHRNAALEAVLEESAAPGADEAEAGAAPEDSAVFQEEHLLRLKAEADAQDKAQRLRVAQEQLAEYASEKSAAAAEALQQAEAVEATLGQLLAAAGGGGSSDAVLAALAQLKARLSEAAVEAAAFSEQQQADVERLKRSSQQAELMDVDGSEPKRVHRDGSDSSSSEQQQAQQDTSSTSSSDDEALDPALAAALPAPAAAAAAAAAGGSGRPSADGGGPGPGPGSANGALLAGPGPGLGPGAGLAGGPGPSRLSFRERCKYIPLRLRLEERRLLRLLEAALNVSEYTDKVDILAWRTKASRVHAQLKDFCAILCGLVVAQDYKRGQQLINDKDFDANDAFFQDVFEIGRRYKVMNPEKLRSEFGKLMYMLMDSADTHVQELLGFACVRPLRTVSSLLEAGGRLGLLDDPLLEAATAEIVAGDRPRTVVQREIRAKERAREALAKKYRHAGLSEEAILWAIYSIADNNTFLLFNRDPIDRMIRYFTATFSPASYEEGRSLAITGGRGGARLTHSHERQYHYVLQSLLLWREVMADMFKLWYLAEADMLREGGSYRLCDTGQGLNRVQSAPRLSKAMAHILARCQAAIGTWVGSSVVHLGDHNVPNALFFLNKYTQVPQILNPVVAVLDAIPGLARDPQLAGFIGATWGSAAAAQQAVLLDFCRHAFDGSGADNFFDAGSCIDGRLTSAWNWCSQLHKKPYYRLFQLAGQDGRFDGEWK